LQVENQVSTYDPTGFMIVFAVDDEESLETAERVLVYLKNMEIVQRQAVILVANKTDLVRSRVIGPSGEKERERERE
jgi:GTPase SAR1 family protein